MGIKEKFSIISSVLDILFPPVCPLCKNNLTELGLCTRCIEDFVELKSPLCIVCGLPFGAGATSDHLCGECIKGLVPFSSARSFFLYQGPLVEAIHRFKYSGRVELAKPLGQILADSIGPVKAVDMVMPVPLHKKRLKQRGFNQSLLLAQAVAKKFQFRLDYLSLKRIRETGPQTELKKEERLANVRGAFELNRPRLFKNKRILLVDDVYTTGATVKECAKVLKKAGAEVLVATLARPVRV